MKVRVISRHIPVLEDKVLRSCHVEGRMCEDPRLLKDKILFLVEKGRPERE